MSRVHHFVLIAAAWVGFGASSAVSQVIEPPFNSAYVLSNLGSPPGVPTRFGGLTLKHDDPNVLLIGGSANLADGAIYSIGVVRAGGHIVNFTGTAVVHTNAPYNDGGVVYGPDNVLFLARWPVNQLGQSILNSGITNRVIDLAPFNVEASLAALNFVPPNFPGAGDFKMVTYSGGQWLDVTIAPDGAGTYDVVNVTEIVASRLPCGPEGFVYVPAGLPFFPTPSMLVAEYGCATIGAFELDVDGNPRPETRRVFMTLLPGAEGAFIDPTTGDFLFSTFGGDNKVVVVRGFSAACSTCRGDLNVDNYTNGGDIQQFVTCYMQTGSPVGLCRCGDMDNNDHVGESDVPLFIDKIMGTIDPDLQCP